MMRIHRVVVESPRSQLIFLSPARAVSAHDEPEDTSCNHGFVHRIESLQEVHAINVGGWSVDTVTAW